MKRRNRYKDVQLVQLRSFCLAATEGNFSGAAKMLGLSRAGVWQHVRALEQKLGLTLVRRRGRAVELTPEGRVVFDLVLPHVNGLDSLERLAETRRVELPQQLTVTSSPYLFVHHLRQLVQEFSAAHAAVRLRLLVEIWPEQMLRFVEQGEADVAVFVQEQGTRRSAYVEQEMLMEWPLLLLTSAQHPLARKKRVEPLDLVDWPMVLAPPGNPLRRAQDRILRQHDLEGRIHTVMENHYTDLMLHFISAGLGIALWYLSLEEARAFAGVHARVFDPDFERLHVVMSVRKFAHLPPMVQEFRQLARRRLTARRSPNEC
jgi:DNA-binding transcriptional LysR family regulator